MFWNAILLLGGLGIGAGLLIALARQLTTDNGQRTTDNGQPAGDDGQAADAERPPYETRMTVLVRCSGGVRARNRFLYEGLFDCHAAMRLGGGPKDCAHACIGLGSCVKGCPSGALSLVDEVAVSDPERCTACNACLSLCPKGIIAPVPYHADVHIACSSRDKQALVRNLCDIGCLGCRICEKVCAPGAMRVEDNLASIDFEICTGCGDCAEKCPRKLITDAKLDRGPRLMEG
jgi:ferredoxin